MPRLGASSLARGGGGGGRRRRSSGSRPETAGNANVGGTYRAPRPQPTGVFSHAPLNPVTRAQRAAAHRTRRARVRLPKVPIATPPILKHPTPAQTRAAHQLIAQSITRAVGTAGTATERLARRNELNDEILHDPRYARERKAIRHYATAEANHAALAMAKLYGTRGSKQQRIRAGKRLISAQQRRDTVRPGPQHTRVGVPGLPLATIDLTSLGNTVGRFAAAHTSVMTPSAENTFLSRVGGDVKTLGEAPFVGGYSLLKAGAHDVAHNTVLGPKSQTGKLASGIAVQTVKQWEHPGKYLQEHPLLFGLDVLGGVGAVGRVGGAVARGVGDAEKAGVRGAAARAGTTVRPPLALTDEPHGPIRERTYSKDLVRKAAQVAADRGREPLRDGEGKIVYVEQRGHRVPVLKASTREREGGLVRNRAGLLGDQTNFETARANAGERLGRERDAAAMHVPNRAVAAAARAVDRTKRAVKRDADVYLRPKGIKSRAGRDSVLMVADGTIRSVRTWTEDLTKYRNRVAAALEHHRTSRESTPFLHKGEVAEANRNLRLADKMLEASPEQRQRIVSLGEDLGRHLNSREGHLLAEGVLSDPKRVERARVIHAAVQHLDAKHFTDAETAELERAGMQVRHPEKEAAYRQAQGDARDAVTARRDAEQTLRTLEHKRSRLVGSQASRRGRRMSEGGTAVGTKAERTKLAKLDARIRQARADVRAKTKAARDAKVKLGRTERPPLRAALRHRDGRFLPTSEIHAAIEAAGRDPKSVAYLPTGELGGRAFHSRFDQNRPVMDKAGTRTGSQYAKGATRTSAELLAQQGVRQGTQLNKARAIDRFVSDNGTVHPSGRDFTMAEAEEIAKRLEVDTSKAAENGTGIPYVRMKGGVRMTPMRRFSAKLPEDAQRIIRDELQGPGAMDSLHQFLLNDRFLYDEAAVRKAGAENVVLVPTRKLEQMQKHLRPAGVIERFFQFLNRPFRMAVLPQPRWLTGNFVEPYIIRLTVAGSGLNVFGLGLDWVAAGKALRAMERSGDQALIRAAHEIRAQQYGGLFIGNRGANVRRGLESFPKLEEAYGNMVARLPVTKQAAEMSQLALKSMGAPFRAFFKANRVIEGGAQRAAFGRQFRKDLQEFTGSWTATIRLQQKAIEEAARGLVNTATQERFMRAQHELLGKYEGYGPVLRAWIQGPMPFLPWALNAARFVYWTMPVHHTLLTDVLIKTSDVVAKDWAQQHADTPPGGLRLAQRTPSGGYVDFARYTPYGLTGPVVEGDVASLTDSITPQLSSTEQAIAGKDPFGRDLQVDPRTHGGQTQPAGLETAGIAGYGLLESLVPGLATARRLREGGGTAYAGSNVVNPSVKPGTDYMSAPRRVFDPFRPTYLHAPTTSKPVPAAGPQRAEALSQQDRIDQALDSLDTAGQVSQAQQDRIDAALDAIGIP